MKNSILSIVSGILLFAFGFCTGLVAIPPREPEAPNNTREGVLGQTAEMSADIGQKSVQGEYETILMNCSGYCKKSCCCGKWADGYTASGHKIQLGDKFVAAPSKYPFGTVMDVSGYGVVLVLDRGGAIKGNKLDLYFPTHQAAINFGRQQLKVKVRLQ